MRSRGRRLVQYRSPKPVRHGDAMVQATDSEKKYGAIGSYRMIRRGGLHTRTEITQTDERSRLPLPSKELARLDTRREKKTQVSDVEH